MKDLNLLVWLTQLGMSIAVPLGGFSLLGLWLRNRFSLGVWVVLVCCLIGLVSAADGMRRTIKAMELMEGNIRKAARKKERQEAPPVSFNDHE